LRYKNASNKTAHQNLGRTTEISLGEARELAKLQKNAAIVTSGSTRSPDSRSSRSMGRLRPKISAASAYHHLKLIRHPPSLAVEWGMVDKNPAAGIKQFNEDNTVEHYLDGDELDRLVSVLHANDPPIVC
jgi:site-specific recombinase XerC